MLDEEDMLDDANYARLIQDQAAHDERVLGAKTLSPTS